MIIEKTIPFTNGEQCSLIRRGSLRLSLPKVEKQHYLDKLRNKDNGQWEREGRTVFKITLTVAEYNPQLTISPPSQNTKQNLEGEFQWGTVENKGGR